MTRIGKYTLVNIYDFVLKAKGNHTILLFWVQKKENRYFQLLVVYAFCCGCRVVEVMSWIWSNQWSLNVEGLNLSIGRGRNGKWWIFSLPAFILAWPLFPIAESFFIWSIFSEQAIQYIMERYELHGSKQRTQLPFHGSKQRTPLKN